MPNAKPVIKRDPAAPAPTPKPPKVGSLPKPPKPPKPKATQAGVSVTSVTMKGESGVSKYRITTPSGEVHEGPVHGSGGLIRGSDGLNRLRMASENHPDNGGLYAPKPGHVKMYSEWTAHGSSHKAVPISGSKVEMITKSEPTAILAAARVDAEVERRLAEIEGAREGLSKAGWGKMTPDTPEKQAAYDAGDQAEKYGRIAYDMMADPRTLPDLATYQSVHQQAAQAARNAAAKHREAGDFVDAASRFEQAAAAHDRFGRPEHHAALQASAAIWQPEQRPKDPQATATKYRNAAAAWRKAGYEKAASGLEAEAHAIGRTPIAKSESDHVRGIEAAREGLGKAEKKYHLWVRKQKLVGGRYHPDEGFVQITRPNEPLTHSQALTMKGKQSRPQHVLLVEHGQDPHDHATKERNAPSGLGKSESDHVREFVLGLDLGGTRRWHSACVSKDDSNLGRAVKGKQADRTYSREGSRGVPGICTGCGGELQMDPAPREVDAPVYGEDHNEHKIEKGETMRKGYDDEVSKEWVHGHLKELSQRADEHQKAGRKQDADALRAKIKTIKEKHGMGPGGKSGSRLNKAFYKEPGQGRFENVVFQQGDDADEALQIADEQGEEAAVKHLMQWHNPGEHETSDESSAGGDDFTFESEHHPGYVLSYRPSHRYIGLEFDTHKGIAKSELLAGARHHYARVVRFQQLGKSEEVAKSAAMCALYVAKMGADPSKDVPAEVRNCGPVDLQKAGFHLDREVRGLPAKMLPLIKATPPDFGSSLGEEERRRDETPIHGHKDLGLKLMSWHSSMHDPIYGTGSTFHAGKPVPKWQVQATLDNISKLHREAQTPEGAQRGGWGPAEVRELGGIKNHLTRLLKTPKASIQKALTGAPGDTAPGATMDGGALQLAEDAKHGAKSDVIGEVGKGGGKTLDIGDGYHVHAHGFDANGNHSVWVSKGAGRARKIQSGQNLPSVHSQRGAGEKKGHLPITKKIAEEIKDYHRKYHEKPVKKTEPCAPAGSPLEKLNAMIKGAGGASLSKAARAPRPPQEHNEDHVRELHLHADNNESLLPQVEAIESNLANRMAAGKYDHTLASKAFGHLADAAAKSYQQQFSSAGGGAMFSPADRREVANRLADNFRDEAGLGNLDNRLHPRYRERGVTLANHPATKAPDLARKVVLPSDG